MNGASIGGHLVFRDAHLDGGKGSPALTAQDLTVAADMLCVEGFHASGEIDIDGAHIGGQLVLRDAHLDGAGGPALTAHRLTVTPCQLLDRLRAAGRTRY